MPPPPQASAAAAFFERTLSDDGDCENGFASELGEREAVCDAYEAPPPSFYRQVRIFECRKVVWYIGEVRPGLQKRGKRARALS